MFNRSFNQNSTNFPTVQAQLPLKKNKFAGVSGVVMVCTTLAITQALLGCSHSKDKIATDDDSKEKTSKTSKTAKTDTVDCASPNVANSIQQSVIKQITDQASGNAQQLAKQAGLDGSNMSLADMVTQMSVAVSNVVTVPGQSNQCQASVAITLPDSQINNANQIAKSLNQPPIAERLATKGLTVQNNVISTPTALFNISANGGDATPVATSGTGATLLAEISDILANSQIKQMMSKSVPTVAGVANPAVVAGTAATTAAVASHADTNNTLTAQPSSQSGKTSSNTGSSSTGSSSHSGEPSTHTTSQHASHKATTPVHHARPAPTDDSDDDSDDSDDTPVVHHTKKPVHTVTKTEHTTHVSGDKNLTTTTTTHTVTKAAVKVPAEHTAPKATSSDEPKLTIEEKNEKY